MDPEDAVVEAFDRLRGRVCGYIEALGLPDRQERGAIQTFKSLTYDGQKEIVKAIEDSR